jgi:hypothetical protein
VLAVGAGAYGHLTGLRIVRGLGVVLAQLPVPLLLADAQASAATTGLALAALAAADLAVLHAAAAAGRGRRGRPAVRGRRHRVGARGLAARQRRPRRAGPAAAALVACAASSSRAAASPLAPAAPADARAVVTLGAAVHTPLRDDLPTAAGAWPPSRSHALVGARLPRSERTGPVVGALLVAARRCVARRRRALGGAAPAHLAARPRGPCRREPTPRGRRTRPDLGRTRVTPLVLLAAAARAAVAGTRCRGAARALPVAALGLAGAVLRAARARPALARRARRLLGLPGARGRRGGPARPRRGRAAGRRGVVLALHASAWSTASQTATLVVLPLVALGCAALAVPRQPLPAVPVGLAGLLATAHVGALGAALDLAADQVGGLLLVAVAGALLAAALLDGERTPGARARRCRRRAALALAAGDVGWLSWVLAGLGLLALATALRPDRRAARPSAGCCCRRRPGCGWPTPGSPPGALRPAAGGRRARPRRPAPPRRAGHRSWAAYGPGLLLALVPSLLAALAATTSPAAARRPRGARGPARGPAAGCRPRSPSAPASCRRRARPARPVRRRAAPLAVARRRRRLLLVVGRDVRAAPPRRRRLRERYDALA